MTLDHHQPLLDIQGLSVVYRSRSGDFSAIQDMDLAVYPGEVVGIVGESGSGKSTFAYGAVRLLRPPAIVTAGSVIYRGRRAGRVPVDILNLDREALRALRWREVAIVFQNAMGSLNPVLRIEDQLVDPMDAHLHLSRDEKLDKVRALLALVGIPSDRLRRYPHELSGGMRQRVVMAMALSVDPEVVLMDEPTSALDVVLQREILSQIMELRDRLGLAVVFITHDLPLLLEVADRVAVIHAGQLVETADATDLRRSTHPRTRALLGQVSRPARAMTVGVRDRGQPAGGEIPSAPAGVTERRSLILDVRAVSKDYRLGRRGPVISAVRDVSFGLHRGRALALVGESGSGKSTVAKLLAGHEPATSGRILLDGQPLSLARRSDFRRYKSQVQMVFQDPFASLNPARTVRRHLEGPLRLRHLDRAGQEEQLRRLLDQVRLTPAERFLTRYPHELSGGQRQRVAIARALAVQPRVLLADEPVSMLDISIRREVLSLLRDLRHRFEVSVLYITHDLVSARYFADDILVMYAGEIVERGPAEEIIRRPTHPYTQLLVASAPGSSPDAAWLRSYRRRADIPVPVAGCRFADRCPSADHLCRTATPAATSVDPGHLVACWHPDRAAPPSPENGVESAAYRPML
jgi:peptide/nickel transport system ATP-binding protein